MTLEPKIIPATDYNKRAVVEFVKAHDGILNRLLWSELHAMTLIYSRDTLLAWLTEVAEPDRVPLTPTTRWRVRTSA